MEYKSKYLKYKEKYIQLKLQKSLKSSNMKGGVKVTIPTTFPGTYSFLFMPLLYYTLDNSSVTLPDGFEQAILECINNIKDMTGNELPFTDLVTFITYLRFILNSNGVNSFENLETMKDGDHHIPGPRQEIITNYRSDENINGIISCLAQMLIERHSGKEFVYLK